MNTTFVIALTCLSFGIASCACNKNREIQEVIASRGQLPSSDARYDYKLTNLIDGELSTSWQESSQRSGVGEWVEFRFRRPQNLSRIRIANGFQHYDPRYGDLYFLNNRLRRASLCDQNRQCLSIDFADAEQYTEADLPFKNVSRLRLTILSVYRGTRWNDTSISEVELQGPPSFGITEILEISLLVLAGILAFRYRLALGAWVSQTMARLRPVFQELINTRNKIPEIFAEPEGTFPAAAPDRPKSESNKHRNSLGRTLRSIGLAFAVLMAALVLALLLYGLGLFHTIFVALAPPVPVLVSSDADDLSSRLLEYSGRVHASIRNEGGSGNVIFEVTVMQDGHSWTMTALRHFESQETADMEIVFDEISFLGGGFRYTTRAYAFGK